MAEIRILSREYDLTSVDDTELATIMKELCETYIMCRYEMSTATLDVWDKIEYVSEEIMRRKKTQPEIWLEIMGREVLKEIQDALKREAK